MSGDKRALLKQWLESGKARLQPLTLSQRELWEASPVPVADMANHICCLIHVQGAITPGECESAIQRVVARQEALRLSFLPGKERPVQMIRDAVESTFNYRELTSEQARPEAIEELAREIFRKPFDLLQGPLYRTEFLRRSANEIVLAFAIHHAIADGWTLGVFVQDLCIAYMLGLRGDRTPLPLPDMSYTEWGAMERAYWQPAELNQRAAFWKENLAGAPRQRTRFEGPLTASGAHHRVVTMWPAELSDAIREVARRNRTTLFSTLLTGFQIVIADWTKNDDIVVGSPVANRTKQAVRETMGYCAGIVPLRGQVDRARSFTDSVRSVHQTTVDAFANAMPFAELAAALGDPGAPGHNPLFEIRFALQNHPVPDVSLAGISAQLRMRSTGTARYHLACEITENSEGLEVVWLFRPEMFSPSEIDHLGETFRTFMTGACCAPERRSAPLVT